MPERPPSSRLACSRLASSVVALLGASLLAASCALQPHFETPRLSLTAVQIVSANLWEQRLLVRMHVQNPNEREIAVKGLEYTLEVEGQQLSTGTSAASFTVPALGETDFDMSVTANLAGALLGILARAQDSPARSVAYRLTGKLSLSAGWVRSIPFDERGAFTLQ